MEQLQIIKEELFRIAAKDKNTYFICIDGFENIVLPGLAELYSNRVIRGGISETNAISIATGLALTGKTVFVLIMGMYASTRALEQVRLDVGYNNANVKIIGFKPALKYNADAGYSHWAVEDIATMRTVPNLQILSPASMSDAKKLLETAYITPGAFYIRLENLHSDFDAVPEKTTENADIFGKGKNVALVTTGSMTQYAYQLLKPLRYAGIKARLVNIKTIKPFDTKIIKKLIDKKIPIVTLEEQIRGGLGSICSEVIAEYGKKVRFLPIRIDTEKFNLVGSYPFIMEKLMSLSHVPQKIIRFVDKKISLWKIPVLTLKSDINPKMIGWCTLMLFGFIPLVKIEQRETIKHKHKPHFKCYLFGFMRIF